MAQALGFFGSVLTVVGFAQSNIPAQMPQGATVQIKAGYAPIGNDVNDLVCGTAATYVSSGPFDTFNSLIGKSDGGNIDDGAAVKFVIDQPTPTIQSDYISLATQTMAHVYRGLQSHRKMKHQVARGLAMLELNAASAGTWVANRLGGCQMVDRTWLDADFTDGTLSAGLKFRVKAYGEQVEDTLENSEQCSSTIFSRSSVPIPGEPAKRSVDVPRPQWVVDRLVVSNITGEDAELFCSSETSWEPDFVGADGRFCDMESKQLSQLCEVANVDGCVELDPTSQSLVKRTSVARRSVKAVHKQYKNVTYHSV